MAKYGSNSILITVGGTEMKPYVDTINEVSVEALLQESTAFGDTWAAHLYTGIRQMAPLTLEGYYDDTATTGPDAKFNTLGTTVAVVITYGGTKTSSFSAIVQKYTRKSVRKELTRYVVTLQPTGAVTEA